MNLMVISEVAGNGKRITATVQFVEWGRYRYSSEVAVNGCRMGFSHHRTRDAANRSAEGMVDAYLKVHRA